MLEYALKQERCVPDNRNRICCLNEDMFFYLFVLFLFRRIRAKYHKLKYGTELQQGDVKPPIFEDGGSGVGGVGEPTDGESIFITNSNVNWRQGRQLLRQ